MLEIGPGIGVHALSVASSLAPHGVLDVLDVQQEMLDELARRATPAGVRNIVAKHGDAQALPYPDRTFDAAYLVGVLGEIPDQDAALRELRRVLKSSGRLVVGEVVLDPDYIAPGRLREKLCRVGFRVERMAGPGACYLARCRPIDGIHAES
jgi:ubiquinone/menaquinone biosynthesis C-methylase UbiE